MLEDKKMTEPHVAQEQPPSQPIPRKRCIVYVDGYNFYYGVICQTPQWKWLDLHKYFSSLRLDEDVIRVKYFSAEIDRHLRISDRRDRQKRYLSALKADPDVSVYLGTYQLRDVTCRAACKLPYQTPEEKKTDVNIAVNMIADAVNSNADTLILVSGDSDMEPAVLWIDQNYPKIKITVYIPVLPGQNRKNYNYLSQRITCKPLPLLDVEKHLYPPVVDLGNGKTVECPKEWA